MIELEPNLAFGYYNLGHTLFLQGRYQAAASAYGQGQGRDPERNPVQGTRLALCRLATGDAAGALAELQRASGALPRDYRRQVLADTSAVLWALVTHKPDLAGWQGVHEWLNGEAGEGSRDRRRMSSGTAPAPARARSLVDRGVRLAAGLAVVIAIPVAVLFYFQFRSLNDLEYTSAVVLRQLSSRHGRQPGQGDRGSAQAPAHLRAAAASPQSRMEPPDPAFIAPVLTQGLTESPFIDEFWIWSADDAGGGLSGRWLVFDRASAASTAPVAERFREDPDVAARLLPQLRQMSTLRRAIVAFSDDLHGGKHYVQTQLRWASPARERLSSLLAFAVDSDRLHREFFPSLLETRLAPAAAAQRVPLAAGHAQRRRRTRGRRRLRARRAARRAHVPAGVLRPAAAGVFRSLRGAS